MQSFAEIIQNKKKNSDNSSIKTLLNAFCNPSELLPEPILFPPIELNLNLGFSFVLEGAVQ